MRAYPGRKVRACVAALGAVLLVGLLVLGAFGGGIVRAQEAKRAGRVFPDGVYSIETRLANDKVLDVKRASTAKSAELGLYDLKSTGNQRFELIYQGNGLYKIRAVHSRLMLDVKGGSAKSGAKLIQYSSNGGKNQLWYFVKDGNGYSIRSAATGYALTVSGGKGWNGSSITVSKPTGDTSQRWEIWGARTIKQGTYGVSSRLVENGLVLDVKGASTADKANVQVYESRGTYNQRFEFAYTGKGSYTIRNRKSGMYLDAAGRENGANIRQRPWRDNDFQRWIVLGSAHGGYTIRNVATGKYLDVRHSRVANSTNVIQYTESGGKNQAWKLIGEENLPNHKAELNATQIRYSSYDHGKKPAWQQRYIMIHDTESHASAANIAHGWASSRQGAVAAHFVIGRDGSIVQCVGVDRIAHHAGFGGPGNYDAKFGVGSNNRRGTGDDMRGVEYWAGYSSYGMNSHSIGIELCHVPGQNYPRTQLQALDRLIAYLDEYYGFEATIIDHKMWRPSNSDTDPGFSGYLSNYRDHRSYK